MHTYQAFGMHIRSEVPLRLPNLSPESKSDWPVAINYGKVERDASLSLKMGRVFYGKSAEGLQVEVPWAAAFRIQGDSSIVVQPVSGATEQNIALYLTGLILPFLLRQRPLLTLHGSAVSHIRGAIALLGHQGSGKSTTAASLSRRGYEILCDDVIPITPGPRVLPGIPFPKLLPDAYGNLVGNPEEASHLFDGVDKFQVDMGGSSLPADLRILFILEPGDYPRLMAEELKGGSKIQALLAHVATIEGLDDPVAQFTRCAERLGPVPLFRIRRPAKDSCLTEVTNMILTLAETCPRKGI